MQAHGRQVTGVAGWLTWVKGYQGGQGRHSQVPGMQVPLGGQPELTKQAAANTHHRVNGQSREEESAEKECRSAKALQSPSHLYELTVSASYTKHPPLQVEKVQSEHWRS